MQGFGLVEGHASVEDLIEAADGFAEASRGLWMQLSAACLPLPGCRIICQSLRRGPTRPPTPAPRAPPAQVFPEHKFMIVKVLQERKHMCGMTGDGVNDAPALKKADVGIAVAGATDAARGAADIVLTEPGLSTIVTAIIGARKIFQARALPRRRYRCSRRTAPLAWHGGQHGGAPTLPTAATVAAPAPCPQRMTTYARYTVAMTFRICFTFGLITVIYDWWARGRGARCGAPVSV